LTDRDVASLPRPQQGSRITYDSLVPGFGARVTAADARAYILNYRVRGVERRITIGDCSVWKTTQARQRARELRRLADAGRDPLGERHAERAAPTIKDLADRFIAEHLPRLRARSQDLYRQVLRVHVIPALGSKRVADVRHAEIETMHRRIAVAGPYAANRAVAVLSKMLSLAVKWEMRSDNPCRGVERAPEEKRERYLTPAEITRLADVLAAHPDRIRANAIRLLLLTGARKGETRVARWQDFDLAAGVWVKPASTTKTAKLHRIPLSAPTLALLTETKADADRENVRRTRDGLPPIEYVFPSSAGKPFGRSIDHFWGVVRRKAGLPDVRVHDLRHTYASILASSGLSLPIIGRLLGHTQAATTQRYSHLLDDPLRKATETAAAVITGQKPAELIDLARGKRA
jgi:integrase